MGRPPLGLFFQPPNVRPFQTDVFTIRPGQQALTIMPELCLKVVFIDLHQCRWAVVLGCLALLEALGKLAEG